MTMEKEELIDYVKKQIDKAKADGDKIGGIDTPLQDEWDRGEAFGRQEAYEDILSKLAGGKE